MAFGFQNANRLDDPFPIGGLVIVPASHSRIELSPDQARLYGLKLLKAADKADDDD